MRFQELERQKSGTRPSSPELHQRLCIRYRPVRGTLWRHENKLGNGVRAALATGLKIAILPAQVVQGCLSDGRMSCSGLFGALCPL